MQSAFCKLIPMSALSAIEVSGTPHECWDLPLQSSLWNWYHSFKGSVGFFLFSANIVLHFQTYSNINNIKIHMHKIMKSKHYMKIQVIGVYFQITQILPFFFIPPTPFMICAYCSPLGLIKNNTVHQPNYGSSPARCCIWSDSLSTGSPIEMNVPIRA